MTSSHLQNSRLSGLLMVAVVTGVLAVIAVSPRQVSAQSGSVGSIGTIPISDNAVLDFRAPLSNDGVSSSTSYSSTSYSSTPYSSTSYTATPYSTASSPVTGTSSSTTGSSAIHFLAQNPTTTATPYVPPPGAATGSPAIGDPYGSGATSLFPNSGNSLVPNSGSSTLFPSSGNPSVMSSLNTTTNDIRSSLFPPRTTPTTPAEKNPYLPENMQFMRRLVEEFCVTFTHIPRDKNSLDGFGLDQFEYKTIFVFPTTWLPGKAPIFVSPGGNLYWFNGPIGSPARGHFPANAFAGYLDVGMEPQLTPMFGIEARGSIGVYSDFNRVTSQSLRYQGRLVGLLNLTQYSTGVFGVRYIDRQRVKLLPEVGLIWRPNNDTHFRLVFPDPKLSIRLTALETKSSWWLYTKAEYGGDTWTITDDGETIRTDYNDIRIGIGLEAKNWNTANLLFEFGGAIKREIFTSDGTWAKPSDAIYFKGELSF